jgi:hypothetical protein
MSEDRHVHDHSIDGAVSSEATLPPASVLVLAGLVFSAWSRASAPSEDRRPSFGKANRGGGTLIVLGEEAEPIGLDTIQIAERELRIIGPRNGGMQDALDAMEALARGASGPRIAATYPLDQHQRGFRLRASWSGVWTGRDPNPGLKDDSDRESRCHQRGNLHRISVRNLFSASNPGTPYRGTK